MMLKLIAQSIAYFSALSVLNMSLAPRRVRVRIIDEAADRLKNFARRFTQLGDYGVDRQIPEVIAVRDAHAGKVPL